MDENDRGPLGDAGQDRDISRYESVSNYQRARRGRRLPALLGVLSAAVIVVAALVMVGGTIQLHLPQLPSLGGGASQEQGQGDAASATDDTADNGPVTINVAAAGDVYLRYTAFLSGQTTNGGYDYDHLFAHVKDQLSDSDLKIVNQEGVIAGADLGYNATRSSVCSPDELGEAEASAGFNCVLRANDHALDQGYDGLHNELAFWKGQNVQVVGASDPEATPAPKDPNSTYLYEKDGFKVAVLNYSASKPLSPVSSSTDGTYVSLFDEDTMKADVAAARKGGADMVIACMHWGDEYAPAVSAEEKTDAQELADAGVDVILGSHPHVLQDIETLDGANGTKTLCYWSLGSLVNSGIDGAAYIGGIAKLQLQKATDGTCSVTSAELVPTVIHVGSTSDTMGAYAVADYTDALAATNESTAITPDYVQSTLESLYGSSYDSGAGVVSVSL